MHLGGLVVILVVATPAVAAADYDNPFLDETIVSPGVKLGWTFGDRGGLTFGVEVTVLRSAGENARLVLAHGPALNLSWSRGRFHGRLGWEAVSWGFGLEGGPGIVRDADGTHLSLTISPWAGAFVVPYYAHTFVAGAAPVREAGLYGKLPLCVGCEGGSGDGWDWDDDD